MACRISWSPPLHGRLDPATVIAIPDMHQRLGQHGEELVVADRARLVQHRLGGRPGQRDGQPVDRLAAVGRGQLPVGDARTGCSPRPRSRPVTMRGGPERTRSRSTTTATGRTTP